MEFMLRRLLEPKMLIFGNLDLTLDLNDIDFLVSTDDLECNIEFFIDRLLHELIPLLDVDLLLFEEFDESLEFEELLLELELELLPELN